MYPPFPPDDEGARVAGLLVVAALGLLLGAAAMKLCDYFHARQMTSQGASR